jgi:hypothetical protein
MMMRRRSLRRVSTKQGECLNDANNKSPDVEERSRASAGDDSEAAGPLAGEISNQADKFRSTTTIATRGRVLADTSLKSSLAQLGATATVSRMHKPFAPLNFEAIRQGFLEGGVKSTDGISTSSTSSNYNRDI